MTEYTPQQRVRLLKTVRPALPAEFKQARVLEAVRESNGWTLVLLTGQVAEVGKRWIGRIMGGKVVSITPN